jgi:hypothetical protein
MSASLLATTHGYTSALAYSGAPVPSFSIDLIKSICIHLAVQTRQTRIRLFSSSLFPPSFDATDARSLVYERWRDNALGAVILRLGVGEIDA